jgi:hypothetical protein
MSASDDEATAQSAIGGESLGDALSAVVKDALEVAANGEAVGERAEWAEGERVANLVADRGAVAFGGKRVGVVPEFVGAAKFDVDEARGGRPLDDFCDPAESDEMPMDAIFDQRARGHRDWRWRNDVELEPGRREKLQVRRVAEEGEDFVDRARHPLLAVELVFVHAGR